MNDKQRSASETAKVTEDSFGLGKTSGQRGAEILAGIRADLDPSPINKALSKLIGRTVARFFVATQRWRGEAALNLLRTRPRMFQHLAETAIADVVEPIIVEIAAGFSPRGYDLARRYPNATVIEIDLPDVIEDKQNRLQSSDQVTLPPNISWVGADLGVVNLQDLLKDQQADLILAEGLLAYFPYDDGVQICKNVYASLKPGGHFVADTAWTKGLKARPDAAGMFERQAGQYKGAVDTADEYINLFEQANFEDVHVYVPSEMAEQFDMSTDVINFVLVASARKPLEDN